MENFLFGAIFSLLVCYGNTQSVVHDARLDNKELRCLVCKASLEELTELISTADPTQTVKIGGHRLDAKGNYNTPKSVSIVKSEVYLSDQVESICDKMDDYVRALWKSNGTLVILKMIVDGKMNDHMGDVDFVQDEDLNKSLKYYCEGVMEEYEEIIIKHFQNETSNIVEQVCTKETKLCVNETPKTDSKKPEKEL